MGYTQKTWNNPINLDANNLNRIEQGIKNSHDTLEIISEEVSNLQIKHFDISKSLNTLLKDSPNILTTLNDISSIINNNDVSTLLTNVDNFLTKKKQNLSEEEIKQIQSNLKLDKFLKLTDITVNNKSIVQGSTANISLPDIDSSLNINSSNLVTNKAVTEAINKLYYEIENLNISPDIEIPTKLSDLLEDNLHMVVTKKEKDLWNSYKDTFLSELPEHNHDTLYSNILHTHPDIISLIPVVPTDISAFNNDMDYATEDYVKTNGGKIDSISVNNITQSIIDKTVNITIPTDLGDLTNTAGYIKNNTEIDPTVPAWAKEPVKPFYDYNEILNTPKNLTDFKNDANFISKSTLDTAINTLNDLIEDKSDKSHTHDYLPLSGGTLTSTVYMTGGDFLARYVGIANAGHETSTYDKIAILSNTTAGYVRYRTKSELLGDIGALPLTGGTMSGPLVLTGGDAASGVGNMQLDINGQITAKGTTSTLFGRSNSGKSLLLGHGTHSLSIRGTSIEAMASLITRAVTPVSNNNYTLGSSERNWKEIYGTTIYQNGNQVADKVDLNSYLPLTGGTLTGHLTGPSFTGRLRGTDTRSANGAPSTYQTSAYGISEFQEFKGASTIGAPNTNEKSFVYLKTYVPWGDPSGGLPSQLSIGSGLAYRTAASSSAWNEWRQLPLFKDATNYSGTLAAYQAKYDAAGNQIDTTYMKQQSLDAVYETKANNSANYLSKTDAASTYIKKTCTKMTSGSKITGQNDTVVEYQIEANGTRWYRKWASGWIEQGGITTINEVSSVTVSLLTPMTTTTYTASVTNASGKTASDAEGVICVGTKTTTTVQFTCGYINPNSGPINWRIEGI